jgi:hypothetical protein
MQHPMAVGADDGEVCLGVEDDLAGLPSECSQWGQMMRLDVPLTVRAVALGEVEAADRAGRTVVALGVAGQPGIAFGSPMPAVSLCFLPGLNAFRELFAC